MTSPGLEAIVDALGAWTAMTNIRSVDPGVTADFSLGIFFMIRTLPGR
jgi:hypothetical protein